MKKQVKKVVFVGIVVLLLLVAWFILEKIIPDPEDEGTIKILNYNPDDYSMVGISEPGRSYEYYIGKIRPAEDAEEGTEPQYYFFDGEESDFDDMTKYGYYEPYNMKKVFERSTAMTAIELVDENPTDYEQYGLTLDKATVVVGIPYDDAEDAAEFTFLIGNRNEIVTGEGYYFRVVGDDTPEVYLISTLDAGTFLGGAEYFQSTEILPNFGEYYDEIRSFTFTNRAGEAMEFSRISKFESDELGDIIYTNFAMEAPYSCYVNDSTIGDLMLEEIANTQVVQVVKMAPTEEDLEAYGLNNAATIDFKLASGDFTYKFSYINGVIYMMVEGYDTVYMGYGDGSFVDLTAVQFRSNLAWMHEVVMVGQLDIHTPDGDYTLVLDDTVDNEKGTGTWIASLVDHSTGKQVIVSETNGRNLYQDCIGVRYDELMISEENPIVEDEPSFVLTAKYKDHDFTSTARFYKVTSRQYAVLFDDATVDTAGFTVNVVKLKEIVSDIETILAGGVVEAN